MFFIFLAEIPNLNVEIVSEILLGWGEQVTIKLVLELPPKLYCRTLVNLESLTGMWVLDCIVKADMQWPSFDKLPLMHLSSIIRISFSAWGRS